jgi:hypothetical protein
MYWVGIVMGGIQEPENYGDLLHSENDDAGDETW